MLEHLVHFFCEDYECLQNANSVLTYCSNLHCLLSNISNCYVVCVCVCWIAARASRENRQTAGTSTEAVSILEAE